jgi:hypothetical protein
LGALPTISLVVKGEKCTGCKMSKKKDLQYYCVGIWWEKWKKPLVIGKAAKPRCFKNPNINNLPVIWRNDKKKLG